MIRMVIRICKISLKPDQSSKQTQPCLALINPSLILGKEGKLTTQEVVRNTRLCLIFVLVFEQVRHQVDLLDLGKRRRIKFQNKELFFNMYGPL